MYNNANNIEIMKNLIQRPKSNTIDRLSKICFKLENNTEVKLVFLRPMYRYADADHFDTT